MIYRVNNRANRLDLLPAAEKIYLQKSASHGLGTESLFLFYLTSRLVLRSLKGPKSRQDEESVNGPYKGKEMKIPKGESSSASESQAAGGR